MCLSFHPHTLWALETVASSPTHATASVAAKPTNGEKSVVDALITSLFLAEEDSAMQTSLRKALKLHKDLMTIPLQKSKIAATSARGETLVTNEMLRRLQSSSLFDDDSECNDTLEESAKRTSSANGKLTLLVLSTPGRKRVPRLSKAPSKKHSAHFSSGAQYFYTEHTTKHTRIHNETHP